MILLGFTVVKINMKNYWYLNFEVDWNGICRTQDTVLFFKIILQCIFMIIEY